MVALFLALLFFGLLLPFLVVIFVAPGLLLFVRPRGIRPAWWDWGMNEPKPVAKVEPVPVEPVARVDAEEPVPRVAAPEKVKRAVGPRW